MVQQDVALADLREEIGLPKQPARNRGLERAVAQRVVVGQSVNLPEMVDRDQAVDFVAIDFGEIESLLEKVAHVLGHAAFDLQADGFAETPPLQLRLDRA